MKNYFENLFVYNKEMNQRLIDLISLKENLVNEKTISLINHIVNAHQIWNARINNEVTFEVWQRQDILNLGTINNLNYYKTIQIFENRNLDEVIAYSNSNGNIFSNTIADMLFHVINHSTYHRAQIATDLKNCGIEPINTDYIFYKR